MKKKIYEPNYKKGIQKPGKFTKLLTYFLMFMDAFFFTLFFFGILAKEMDLILISGGLAIFLFLIILFLKHTYNMTYQETQEFFVLKNGKKEQKVYYDDIVDWKPSYNEMSVLDKTNAKGKFTRVNMVILKPEVLLRTIADMTFEGKFQRDYDKGVDDPNREQEIVNYLINTKYGYLIEDYIETVNRII